jgi:hypothetical protein
VNVNDSDCACIAEMDQDTFSANDALSVDINVESTESDGLMKHSNSGSIPEAVVDSCPADPASPCSSGGSDAMSQMMIEPRDADQDSSSSIPCLAIASASTLVDCSRAVKLVLVFDYLAPNSNHCIADSNIKLSFFENKCYKNTF